MVRHRTQGTCALNLYDIRAGLLDTVVIAAVASCVRLVPLREGQDLSRSHTGIQ